MIFLSYLISLLDYSKPTKNLLLKHYLRVFKQINLIIKFTFITIAL